MLIIMLQEIFQCQHCLPVTIISLKRIFAKAADYYGIDLEIDSEDQEIA